MSVSIEPQGKGGKKQCVSAAWAHETFPIGSRAQFTLQRLARPAAPGYAMFRFARRALMNQTARHRLTPEFAPCGSAQLFRPTPIEA